MRFCVLLFLILTALGATSPRPSPITAITVALEPDTAMLSEAQRANAALRAVYPSGYALDGSHVAHLSLLQRYVRTSDLSEVYAAVEAALADEQPREWKLRADKFSTLVWSGLAVTMIQVQPDASLLRLQSKLIAALRPYVVEAGDASAFVATTAEPIINPETVAHVRDFVPKATGRKYKPNVTVGVAPPDAEAKALSASLKAFTFSPVAVSVFKLGNFGAAAERLKTWRK